MSADWWQQSGKLGAWLPDFVQARRGMNQFYDFICIVQPLINLLFGWIAANSSTVIINRVEVGSD
ncbi:MAG: hypothetical protein ACRDPY_12095 [Streptosporangiaceae bacterium]